ncbi:MAG: hypothetical protein LBB82_07315 [Treponema sp.]|jgi:hypothetical protein|nr:hypothetical protein [Treponema sp.]
MFFPLFTGNGGPPGPAVFNRRGKPGAAAASGLFALLCVLFVSCATVDPYVPVDQLVENENFAGGAAALESESKSIYRAKDRVLYCLDKGMLNHYAKDWGASSSLLQEGEKAIEANYAVSIHQEFETFLLNDRSREYDGEDYEDIYLNVFNALNYYHRGSMDEALVEIRRMNNKIKNLSVKYGVINTRLQQAALGNNTQVPANPDSPVKFNDSALARYMGMLFYRGAGMYDDARIDQRQLKVAMADAPSIYYNKAPASADAELAIPQGMARLNVLGFTGRAPIKTEEVIRVPLGVNWIKIALPVMTPRPSAIVSVEAALDSGEKFTLELLEDISAVVSETFIQRKNVIYAKSIIRASVKGTAAAVFTALGESDSDNAGIFALLGIAGQAFAEGSEKADLRVSHYFPGKAYVGGINVKPGTYSFTVTFRDANNQVIATQRHEGVTVNAGRLNLTEAVCLR